MLHKNSFSFIKCIRPLLVTTVIFLIAGCKVDTDNYEEATVYSITPFKKVTYQYKPTENESIDFCSINAVRGEYACSTFSIYAHKSLKDISIRMTDLKSSKDLISRDNIDVRVVKVWKQSGDNMWVDEPVDVPELLLYDDSVILKGRRPSAGGISKIRTDISKETSKQFWITVKIPDDAKTGKYKGAVDVFISGKKNKSIELKVNVLPFKLVDPKKDFLIYYRAKLDPNSGVEYENEKDFIKQIENIKAHGFTGASIYSGKKYLTKILMLYQDVGFTSRIPYLGGPRDVVKTNNAIIKKNKLLPLMYYGLDEPNNPKKAEQCRDMFLRIKEQGGVTTTAIKKKYADMIWDSIDVPIYSLCDPEIDAYIKGLNEGTINKNKKKELYYWQINKERPKTARFMSGFYLWKSKLDGIFPYCYQMLNTEDPYDDFTPWEWCGKKWRPHLVTYPSKEGPIDTLQWEAIIEGINDMKYIATLESYIDKLIPYNKVVKLKSIGTQKYLDIYKQNEKLIQESKNVLNYIDSKINCDCLRALEELTESDLVKFREMIVEQILSCYNALKK
ncbi:MAG: hypothetical protein P9M13_06790 [Candidatus Ancaeobacter aquaticus]|nr:hypothetical protein [Candidatus Ancaeobacter aquaticus]